MDFIANSNNKSKKMSFMTKEQIQQAWCSMIRTLIALSHTLPPLPQERYIAMRLYYYDDITPNDYNPPGFEAATDAPDFEFVNESERIEIGGEIKTKYHTISMRLDTAMPNYQQISENEEKIANWGNDMMRSVIVAFEKEKITANTIADALGYARNDEKVLNIMKSLIDENIIKKKGGSFVPIKSDENFEIVKIIKDKMEKEDDEIET